VGCGKSTTIGESASGKSSGPRVWKLSAVGMVVLNGTEVRMWNTDGQGESGR
jgi:ABC-type protease/lipase transport system fused ATPase/permease subunit